MKRFRFKDRNGKAGLVVLGFAGLSLLAAGGGGRDKPDNGRDRADTVSAGEPATMTQNVKPLIGTDDRAAASGSKDSAKDASGSDKNSRSPESITEEVGRGMLSEFQRAQANEIRALEHRNKLELKELKSSQSSRLKEWERHEKEVRHKFFAEHRNGPDRRAYIQNFLSRHKDLDQSFKDELAQKIQEQEARSASLRNEQAERLKSFKESLSRGERPAAQLWPTGA